MGLTANAAILIRNRGQKIREMIGSEDGDLENLDDQIDLNIQVDDIIEELYQHDMELDDRTFRVLERWEPVDSDSVAEWLIRS